MNSLYIYLNLTHNIFLQNITLFKYNEKTTVGLCSATLT